MINGKTFAECIETLQAMRPKKEDKGNTGFDYIKFCDYQMAMDHVFGNDHYDVSYSDPIYRQVSSGQEMVTVKASIDIYDDDRKRVKHIEGFGDKAIEYAKNSGKADLTNLTTSAAKAAFKDAAKYLGIFGYNTSNEGKSAPYKSSNTAAEKDAETKKEDKGLMMFKTQGSFFEAGERDGKKIWKIGVVEKAEPNNTAEVVFYPNNYKGCTDWFNRLFSTVSDKKAVTLKLEVRPCGEREGKRQYVFLKNVAAA